MGHSNVSTTEEFYTQVDKHHEAKAARVIQSLIDSGNCSNRSEKTDARMTPEHISHRIGGKEWMLSEGQVLIVSYLMKVGDTGLEPVTSCV